MRPRLALLGLLAVALVPAAASAGTLPVTQSVQPRPGFPLPVSLLDQRRLGRFCRNAANTTAAVDCWLQHHPNIANGMWYDQPGFYGPWMTWPASVKNRFHESFNLMVLFYAQGMPSGYPQPIANPLPLQGPPDYTYGGSFVSESDGQTVYLLLVGNNLAAELTGAFPWSIAAYTGPQASALLKMGDVLGNWVTPPAVPTAGYYFVNNLETTAPAPPAYIVAFLRQNNIIGTTATNTVVRLFKWESNLRHFFVQPGGGELEVFDLFWGLPAPPVSVTLMIEGTTYTGPGGPWFAHWTLGCSGTRDFTKVLLQTLNIPVLIKYRASHATPVFPTVDLALTHGDDPYSGLDVYTPVPGFAAPQPEEFFVTVSQLQSLCNPAWPDPSWCGHKVGIRPAILAINYGADYLMKMHCDDLSAGKTHGTSSVLAFLSFYFPELPLSQLQVFLESAGMWTLLDAKVSAANFCH